MIHCLPVNNKYLMMIAKGEKNIEVHIYSRSFRRIKPGDILLLFDSKANIVRARVKDVRIYDSLHKLLENEDFRSILPSATDAEECMKEIEKIYSRISKAELRRKKFIAIDLDVIDYIRGID